jgi:cytoskeleton protein RodZ
MSDENISTEQQDEEPVAVNIELPGKRLQAQREEIRMTRDEVAHNLHLDVRLITALEEDDYEKLPAPSYICGYLRSYARLLKLPENEIVESYTHGQEISAALLPENVNIASKVKPVSKTSYSPIIMVLILLAVIAVGFILFETTTSQKTDQANDTVTERIILPSEGESRKSTEEATTYINNETATVDSPATPATDNEPTEITEFKKNNTATDEKITLKQPPVASKIRPNLRLAYFEDSWTEVVDAGGERLLYRLVAKGSDIALQGKAPFTLLLGNAPGVKVYYQGKEFDHERYQRERIAYFRLGSAE